MTMHVDFMEKKIKMTAKEAKEAGRINTEKYAELMTFRSQFPDYAITVVKAKSKGGNFIRMTTDDMKGYIEKHDDEKHTTMIQFNKLRGMDENGKKISFAAVASIGELKAWFLGTYPEIEKFGAENRKILADVREARNASKAA